MGIQLGHSAVFLHFLIFASAFSNASSILGDDGKQARTLFGLIASDRTDQWDEAAKIYQSFASISIPKPRGLQSVFANRRHE